MRTFQGYNLFFKTTATAQDAKLQLLGHEVMLVDASQ